MHEFTLYKDDQYITADVIIDSKSMKSVDKMHFEGGVYVVLAPKGNEASCAWLLGRQRLEGERAEGNDESSALSSLAGVIHQELNEVTNRFQVRIPAIFTEKDTDQSLSARTVIERLKKMKFTRMWCFSCSANITLKREYSVLMAAPRIAKSFPDILRPKVFTYGNRVPNLPDVKCFTVTFAHYLQSTFNVMQRKCIHFAAAHMDSSASSSLSSSSLSSSSSSSRYTLVQGPPGTGKTHCIWGILNVIHLLCYQRYYEKMLKAYDPKTYDYGAALKAPSLKPRILICAPSNAAVDEIMFRILKSKFRDGHGRIYAPGVVRVGASKRVESRTEDEERLIDSVSVDNQVKELAGLRFDELSRMITENREGPRRKQMAVEIENVRRHIHERFMANQDYCDAQAHLLQLLTQRERLDVEHEKLVLVMQSRTDKKGKSRKLLRDVENIMIQNAELVFTTLSSASRNLLTRSDSSFATILIDESAQATEIACLQALQYNPEQLILVGDPRQLPATVVSRRAERLGYNRSLFERLQDCGCDALRLTMQYRMHPEIRRFPSANFYEDSLVDAASVLARPRAWYHDDVFLRPFLFYDVHGYENRSFELGSGTSLSNAVEADFVIALLHRLHMRAMDVDSGASTVSISVITPYRDQVGLLRREIGKHRNLASRGIKVNTVDSYQGQEADVIVMSCVKSRVQGTSSSGFVADLRRMNVAITRAKQSLWIVGSARALSSADGDWCKLIADAQQRNCLMGNVNPSDLVSGPLSEEVLITRAASR